MTSIVIHSEPPPVLELLCCCARVSLEPRHVARIRALLDAGCDWDALLAAADAHRLLPFIGRHLPAAAPEAIPEPVVHFLHDELTLNAARNLQLAAELVAILRLFSEHDVDAVPFKGPVLAQQVYGSLGLRQIFDLDILLRGQDVVRARRLLLGRGYTSSPGLLASGVARHFEYQHRLRREWDDMVVELHWTVAPRNVAPPIGINELRGRAPFLLLGHELSTLMPDDLLLVLCIHGAKHRWHRLEWLCGVGELMRSDTIDWPRATTRAAELGVGRMLRLATILAHELLDVPLPEPVLRAARLDHTVTDLAAEVVDALAERAGASDVRTPTNQYQFQLRSRERPYDRLRYMCYRPLIRAVRLTWELAGRMATMRDAAGR